MFLSIIIPIYNVEKYIGKCFDSIYNQRCDETSFEVIAMNDGTPDNSMHIVQQYAEQHTNVHIINQKNGGVSVARNTGLQYAKGDYIAFVDPDDWIGDSSLKKIFSFLQEVNSPEIAIFNSLNISDLKYNWHGILEENIVYSGSELFSRYLYFRGSVCGAIYKTKFLRENNLCFPVGIKNAEDTIFFNECLSIASKVCFRNIDFYHIFSRPGSASKTFTKKNIGSCVIALDIIEDFINTHNISNQSLPILEYLKYSIISNSTNYAIKAGCTFQEIVSYGDVRKYLPIKADGIPINRLKIKVLNISYLMFYQFVKLKNFNK